MQTFTVNHPIYPTVVAMAFYKVLDSVDLRVAINSVNWGSSNPFSNGQLMFQFSFLKQHIPWGPPPVWFDFDILPASAPGWLVPGTTYWIGIGQMGTGGCTLREKMGSDHSNNSFIGDGTFTGGGLYYSTRGFNAAAQYISGPLSWDMAFRIKGTMVTNEADLDVSVKRSVARGVGVRRKIDKDVSI
jgi:hypothetical protein